MDEKADDARMANPLFERMLARLENKFVKIKKPNPAQEPDKQGAQTETA
jgi:hypothetical protein